MHAHCFSVHCAQASGVPVALSPARTHHFTQPLSPQHSSDTNAGHLLGARPCPRCLPGANLLNLQTAPWDGHPLLYKGADGGSERLVTGPKSWSWESGKTGTWPGVTVQLLCHLAFGITDWQGSGGQNTPRCTSWPCPC